LFGLYDVLNSVGVGWETHVAGTPGESLFDVQIVAASREPFQCASGVPVTPQADMEEAGDTDVAIVPGLVTSVRTPPIYRDERELSWLSRQQARGAIVASACTGAIILAESEMLDGWEATTHWAWGDLFRVHYPKVKLRLEKNLCASEPNNQIVTSGGATAWHELALHLICGLWSRTGGSLPGSKAHPVQRIPIALFSSIRPFHKTRLVSAKEFASTDCNSYIGD
jgi:transcriptional regulator GlxA family with amidase domain